MVESEYSGRKEILSVALEQFLETPTMQTVEDIIPCCRHCGKEIRTGDLVFGGGLNGDKDENEE